jgi:hypothetical protein
MNVLGTLSRAEAVIDLLRVNQAGEAAHAMAKTPRESKPAAPPQRTTRKTKGLASKLN